MQKNSDSFSQYSAWPEAGKEFIKRDSASATENEN